VRGDEFNYLSGPGDVGVDARNGRHPKGEEIEMAVRKISLLAGGMPLPQRAIVKSYPFYDGKTYSMPLYSLDVTGMANDGSRRSRRFGILRFGIRKKDAGSHARISGVVHPQTHVIKRWIPTYKVHSYPSVEDGAWQVLGNLLIHDGPDDPTTEAYGTLGCLEITGSPGGFITFNDYLISLSGSKKATREQKLAEIGASGRMTITYIGAKRPPILAS
jgi:hypothetical protein